MKFLIYWEWTRSIPWRKPACWGAMSWLNQQTNKKESFQTVVCEKGLFKSLPAYWGESRLGWMSSSSMLLSSKLQQLLASSQNSNKVILIQVQWSRLTVVKHQCHFFSDWTKKLCVHSKTYYYTTIWEWNKTCIIFRTNVTGYPDLIRASDVVPAK